MEQYVAVLGCQVAHNLEGIALAREDKKPRQYQSDAQVHQQYCMATTGGGAHDGDDASEEEPHGQAPQEAIGEHFRPLPWGIVSKEDMLSVLNFSHRLRLSPFAKALLNLPIMTSSVISSDDVQGVAGPCPQSTAGMRPYAPLMQTSTEDHLALAGRQDQLLTVNHDEAEVDVGLDVAQDSRVCPARSAQIPDGVYATPSAYISHLIDALPPGETLTHDQALFMAQFATACDETWQEEIERRPPSERRVRHILLLGQGGSGKTHVIQKLVFKAVQYIWPSPNDSEPTLMVVASSNAQAKNISTARTIHNASACLLYTSPSPRDGLLSRMPSSA